MSFRLAHRSLATVFKTATGFALALGLFTSVLTPAQAADMLAVSPVAVSDPVCHEQSVINSAVAHFGRQVRGIPDMPQVSIQGVSDVRATRFEAKTYPAGIERHYCSANAHLSSGENRKISYLVEQSQGFASVGRNIESCVDGFDKWFIYDGHCRTLR